MMALVGILGWSGELAKALFQWLSRRSLAEIGCLALVVLILVQHLELVGERHHAAKLDAQIVKCTEHSKQLADELVRISAAKNQQKIITQDRIKTVIRTIHDADVTAHKVETAPPAPDCHHDSSMLGADL